jgi:uncharacterized phage protein gp47/JayE
MPFQRPTVAELIERIQRDLESRLPGTDARLRRSLVRAVARVQAGSAHGQHGHLEWIANQVIPDTAEAEYLARWAAIWKVTRLAAVAATGPVEFTGTDGTVIPAGTEVESGDGIVYTTDADTTIDAGTATADVTAVEAGEAGNQSAGVTLSLTSPIAGLESQAAVAGDGLTGGSDTETDASLRKRLLQRIRNPPHGGARSDYVDWALAGHPDVTRAWAYPNATGLGTVTVRLMTDKATSDGIPTQSVIDAVASEIAKRRPVTADVSVVAPVAVPFDVQIANLMPDKQRVRDAIQAAIEDLLDREGAPGATIRESDLREAISTAAGEEDHDLVSPTGDVTHGPNEIPVPGTITWS